MTTITRRSLAALSLSIAAMGLSAPALATDGYFLNGVGAAAKGAGGVAIAMPQDGLAIVSNPAAAAQVGKRIDIGAELFVPRRGAQISGNGAGLNGTWSGNGANPFVLPEASFVHPLLGGRFAVAIAISGNGGMNTHYKANPFASFGATGAAGVNLRQISVSPTLAMRVADGHSIGVSPVLVIQSFKAHGIQPFAAFSQDPANVSNRGTDWTLGGGLRFGYLGSIGDAVKVGGFYQTKARHGRFKKYAGLFAGRGGFEMPESWGVGLSVKPVQSLTLGVDYKHIAYSDVPSVGTPLSPLLLGKPFGAADGPGFGWRDIDVWKAGAVWQASDRLPLRAGYGHSENPVPRSETLLNVLAPGVIQDHFTAGASWKASDSLEVTGYIMRAPRKDVRGNGSIPAPFGGGEADIHLGETAVGLSLGITL
ncbi:MAG TPA: outer membrane protein transport protein, partial [Novosphingobium sp.]|nr:outer membrane protein transport protein [Novosphingobium sp.]